MKKIVLLFVLSSLVLSCSKEENNEVRVVEITINLSNSETYQYHFGFFDEEEGAEILNQALHFDTSEILRNEDTGYSLYKYKPLSGYTGEDYVALSYEKVIDEETNETEVVTVKLSFKLLE